MMLHDSRGTPHCKFRYNIAVNDPYRVRRVESLCHFNPNLKQAIQG
jgi:hypothetical protein